MLKFAQEQEAYFPKALELSEVVDTISTESKSKFARLAQALDGISYNTSAWSTLGHFLFSRSDFARNLCCVPGVSGAQQRLAVYQFLQFAHRMRSHPNLRKEDPKRAFLDYIRRLEQYCEEKQLRQPPTWAAEIDAVRMLTVHASKGLEFPVVYIPQVGKGRFPLKRQGSACVFPRDLLPMPAQDWHDEEEECLFFVGLSRARNTLWLSRAKRYGKQNSNPSPFLDPIRGHLPRGVDIDATLAAASVAQQPASPPPLGTLRVSNREVETYLQCPKQYFFDRVLALGGRRTNTGYLQFHRCVYQVLAWMNSERASGHATDEDGVLLKLEEVWNSSGPADHPYKDFYRREASRLVRGAIAKFMDTPGQALDTDWEVPLQHGVITFRPDHIVLVQSLRKASLTIQRWRTGKPPKKELDEIYSLYARGAEIARPDAEISVEALYLSTNETIQIPLAPKEIAKDLQIYDEALRNILAGEFAPVVSDWNCPRCPHYFICPAQAFGDPRL
ncbi:MAG: 3'-5' exonuclease [Terracidiphilus sp.]